MSKKKPNAALIREMQQKRAQEKQIELERMGQKKQAQEKRSSQDRLQNSVSQDRARSDMMHSQRREAQLAPFKDKDRSKKLKTENKGLQDLLDAFTTSIQPIAPAIHQVIKQQRDKLNDQQKNSLVQIGKTFAGFSFDMESPERSMKDNLDLFVGGLKQLGKFILENPDVILGAASILLPALGPVSAFFSKALGFLLSAVISPALKEPLIRATERASREVDTVKAAVREAPRHVMVQGKHKGLELD